MKISVVCPSRLQVNPTSGEGSLWLDRALMYAIRYQTVFGQHEFEVLVGLDANAPWPPERFSNVRFFRSVGAGQALAVNAAAAHATGDVIVYVEDDDVTYARKLELQLAQLGAYDFVSCNSREIDEHANFLGVNDFPTGWVMTRETWLKVGPFDESFKWHVDTEFLGRANALGVKRLHLINEGNRDERGWLGHIGKHSAIAVMDGEQEPLVARLRNEQGGMATIARDPVETARSREEHERFLATWGEIPW